MRKFRAVTKSGTVYESDGSTVRITSSPGRQYSIRPWRMAVLDRKNISSDDCWEQVRALPDAEIPVVGLSFYVSGRDEWRMSTPIESVEIFD